MCVQHSGPTSTDAEDAQDAAQAQGQAMGMFQTAPRAHAPWSISEEPDRTLRRCRPPQDLQAPLPALPRPGLGASCPPVAASLKQGTPVRAKTLPRAAGQPLRARIGPSPELGLQPSHLQRTAGRHTIYVISKRDKALSLCQTLLNVSIKTILRNHSPVWPDILHFLAYLQLQKRRASSLSLPPETLTTSCSPPRLGVTSFPS